MIGILIGRGNSLMEEYHVITKAEIEMMQLQIKETQRFLDTTRSYEEIRKMLPSILKGA